MAESTDGRLKQHRIRFISVTSRKTRRRNITDAHTHSLNLSREIHKIITLNRKMSENIYKRI